MSNEFEKYRIQVRVRINGAVPKDRFDLNIPSIQFDEEIRPEFLESGLKRIASDFEAITPKDARITVEAFLPNNIGGTFMNMASLYVEEELKFVKH